jgi:thiamine biosynthesis protein ThiS
MMVDVQLYSILREKLPRHARGGVTLHLADGATVAQLLEELDIRRNVVISVNGQHERDHDRELRDGDRVRIFSSISGGGENVKFGRSWQRKEDL